MEKTPKIIVNTVIILVTLLGVIVAYSAVPASKSLQLIAVQSASMEPAIRKGSLAIVRPQNDYHVNEVVARKTNEPKVFVVHRIVEKFEDLGVIFFKTKGDASEETDPEEFTKKSIVGKVAFSVPILGHAVNFARTSQGMIILISIPLAIIAHDEFQKRKKREETEDEE